MDSARHFPGFNGPPAQAEGRSVCARPRHLDIVRRHLCLYDLYLYPSTESVQFLLFLSTFLIKHLSLKLWHRYDMVSAVPFRM